MGCGKSITVNQPSRISEIRQQSTQQNTIQKESAIDASEKNNQNQNFQSEVNEKVLEEPKQPNNEMNSIYNHPANEEAQSLHNGNKSLIQDFVPSEENKEEEELPKDLDNENPIEINTEKCKEEIEFFDILRKMDSAADSHQIVCAPPTDIDLSKLNVKKIQSSANKGNLQLNEWNLNDARMAILLEKIKDIDFTKLKKLIMSMNSITSEGMKNLVSKLNFFDLKLEVIDLSLNDIDDSWGPVLVEGLAKMPLKFLNLSGNQLDSKTLKKFGFFFDHNTVLESLFLHRNLIKKEGVAALAISISKSKSIQEFDISFNQIDHVAARSFCESLKKHPTLKLVELHDNPIGDEGCQFYADLLASIDQRQMNLSNTELTNSGCRDLLYSLLSSQHLEKVELSHNALNEEGFREISTFLRDSIVKVLFLKHLNLGDEGMKYFTNLGNIKLQMLDLSNNEISNVGILTLSKNLIGNSRMKQLYLRNNNINDQGAPAIANIIQKTKIGSLNLKGNPIGTNGIKSLAKLLDSPNQNLQIMNLDGLGIEDQAVPDLCQFLEQLQVLTVLKLKDNQISEKELKRILNTIINKFIDTLDVSWNRISNIDCISEYLLKAQIKKLYLSGNAISNISSIISSIPSSSLSLLDLSINSINDEGLKNFQEMLKHHLKIKLIDLSENKLSKKKVEEINNIMETQQRNEFELKI